MVKYQRPPGSVDVKIEEIKNGRFRVKITGTVVNMTPSTITINDATGTLVLDSSSVSQENLEITSTGRFICEVNRSGEAITGKLIAWTPIARDKINKYWKLVGIERRIPDEITRQSPD